jgi:glutathione S-transferase
MNVSTVAPNLSEKELTMQLYHFPSPNPQKVTFALKELGLECELLPVDLLKGEHRQPSFLAKNPFGRVPVLVDGDLTLPESQAIIAYLGDKTGRLWPATPAGRADALHWLFFLSQHLMPPAGEVALRFRAKVFGRPLDAVGEATIKRGEEALPAVLAILEQRLSGNTWVMGAEFGLVDCAYCPVLNVIDKSGFDLSAFPKVAVYLDACRERPAWAETPRLPGL